MAVACSATLSFKLTELPFLQLAFTRTEKQYDNTKLYVRACERTGRKKEGEKTNEANS
jgi:hypothetical protein